MSGDVANPGTEPERVVATLRPHGRVLFWPSILLIAITGVTAWLFGRFDLEWQNLVVLAGGLTVAVLLWLVPLLRWLSIRFVITTRRTVLRKGVLVRTRRELLHSRGYGITVRKTALQSIVRSGDVEIDIGLERPVTLRDVPAADLVQRALSDLMGRGDLMGRHDRMETTVDPNTAWRQAARPDDERVRGIR